MVFLPLLIDMRKIGGKWERIVESSEEGEDKEMNGKEAEEIDKGGRDSKRRRMDERMESGEGKCRVAK